MRSPVHFTGLFNALSRPHHGHLLGVEIGAGAKTAADIGADHVHLLLRHLETHRERMPDAVHALAARDQNVFVFSRLIVAERRARLHEAARGALVDDGLFDHQMGAGHGGFDGASVTECVIERQIVGRFGPYRWCIRRERLEHIGHRRQNLVVDLHRFRAIARRRDALGQHHRDRFADEAHALDRERQLRLVEDLAIGRRQERRHLDVDRVARIREVRHADEPVIDIVAAGEHRDHTGQLKRGGRVDPQMRACACGARTKIA